MNDNDQPIIIVTLRHNGRTVKAPVKPPSDDPDVWYKEHVSQYVAKWWPGAETVSMKWMTFGEWRDICNDDEDGYRQLELI